MQSTSQGISKAAWQETYQLISIETYDLLTDLHIICYNFSPCFWRYGWSSSIIFDHLHENNLLQMLFCFWKIHRISWKHFGKLTETSTHCSSQARTLVGSCHTDAYTFFLFLHYCCRPTRMHMGKEEFIDSFWKHDTVEPVFIKVQFLGTENVVSM